MNNLPIHIITYIQDTFTLSKLLTKSLYMFTNICIYHLGKKYNHIIKFMVNLSKNGNEILHLCIQILYVMSLIPLRELKDLQYFRYIFTFGKTVQISRF